MAIVEIDGKAYEAQAGQMLIEVTDAAGINIPRFCYHKKLSVAASCRMCLVEVEKAPKPMPACATPVTDGMKVFTRSPKALAAQKAVMEFLLINHPLDCPICDQGGECELQDIAVGYGDCASHYQEIKRVTPDKNIGPLIATDMTRCIHCTRCVRFGEEIAGVRELGATGRGEHTRIGLYIEKTVDSELSGNVIDLCPVGALTAKPSRYTARPWEVRQYEGVAAHDALGSHIYLHTFRNRVIRVVPRENENINEVWLSDRDRFAYQGLQSADRLHRPMIKEDGVWKETDWETALAFTVKQIHGVKEQYGPSALAALVSPNATLEELYLTQKLWRALGCDNIDHRLHQCDFRDQQQAPLFPGLGQDIAMLEQCDAALAIGANLRKETPLLNHRLRKAALKRQAKICFINCLDYEYNLPVAANHVVSPDALIDELAGVAKALVENRSVKSSPAGTLGLLAKIKSTPEQQAIAQTLLEAEHSVILLGRQAESHPEFSIIRALAGIIAVLSNAWLGYSGGAANSTGAWLAGAVPHRGPGGQPLETPGQDAKTLLGHTDCKAYLLLGVEPELDAYDGARALQTLQQAQCVIAITAFRTPVMESYAQVLLPMSSFSETSGVYVNITGAWQAFAGVAPPPGEARPAWKILRVLGNLAGVEGFEYTAADQIAAELKSLTTRQIAAMEEAWMMPQHLPERRSAGEYQRIAEMPAYSADPLARRSKALQATCDAQEVKGVHISPDAAVHLRLDLSKPAAIRVRRNNQIIDLPVVSDKRVPKGCALIHAGQSANVALGAWHGELALEPIQT